MHTRRELLITTGASGTLLALTGCLGWIPGVGGNNSGDNTSTNSNDTRNGSPNTTRDDTNNTGTNGGDDADNGTDTENSSDNESNETEDQPEAAQPETDDPINESEAADPEDINASQPTTDDVTLSNIELTTDSSGATATGTLTNESDTTLEVVDVEVTFIEDGTAVTTAMWGTNDLAPGAAWDFEISADGSEYSSVTDCEIDVLL